jgi:DNA-binding response OmpR family regulator
MRILIADDNLFFVRMLANTLSEWGYEVVTAGSGVEAWRALQQKDSPQIAILDWMMSGIDGIELCRKIRATAGIDSTYLILLTAKGGMDNVTAGLDAGADDFLRKPCDHDLLHTRILVGMRALQTPWQQAAQEADDSHLALPSWELIRPEK